MGYATKLWVLILSTILGATTAIFLFIHYLVEHPLNSIRDIMKQSEKRHFLLRIPVKTKDVIGDLALAFNHMLEKITRLDAFKMETERELIIAQEELKYKKALEEKTKMIEEANKALEIKVQEQSLLYDIARMLTSTIEKDILFHIIAEALTTKLGIHEFVLLLYNDEKQVLEVQTVVGIENEEELKKITFSIGEGISGKVVRDRQCIYIEDTRQEPGYLYYKGMKTEDGSFLSLPIITQEKLLGVLNLTRPKPNAFSKEEIQLLEAACSQIAISLMNAKLYERMKEISILDELTQVYNRRYFHQMLPREIIRAKRFRKAVTLLMIDIDHFKKYNDANGHIEGDIVLREFAQLIPHCLREVDFWARYGGEEFAVILPSTPKAASKIVMEKILEAVTKHNFPKCKCLPKGRLTVSIGAATYPTDAKDMKGLINRADYTLYEAKRNGRNRYELYKKTPKDPVKKPSKTKETLGKIHQLFSKVKS